MKFSLSLFLLFRNILLINSLLQVYKTHVSIGECVYDTLSDDQVFFVYMYAVPLEDLSSCL